MFPRAAVIIVLGFMAYASMLNSPFRLMDDRISIINNASIKSMANAPKVFEEGYFHDQEYYRPLVNLSFMAEYQLFGFKSFFYNLDNLILHILNALLVVLLVTRLTNNPDIGFAAGLLFVLHPIQWEAVCNVPGRSILLSAFFSLSSFILFLDFYRSRRMVYLLGFLPLFLGSLLCKESAAMLPLIILAYLCLDQNSWGNRLRALWPFAAIIVLYIGWRVHLGVLKIDQSHDTATVLLGFLTFLRSVITDLRLLLFPLGLHYDSSRAYFLLPLSASAWGTIVFWTFALVGLFYYRRKITPFTWFLIVWFWLELLPVAQLVRSIGVGAGYISTAEHFMYLACIPVFIGLVLVFNYCFKKNQEENFFHPAVLKLIAAAFLIFLFLTAVEQSIYASNEFNMIGRSLGFEPMNPRLQAQMGMLHVFRGDIVEAEKHFHMAVVAEPLNPRYHIYLGTAYCQEGRWIEALEQYVAFEPDKEDKDLVARQSQAAMAHIQEQLKAAQSFDARGWLAIGVYDIKTGKTQAALADFEKVITINPQQSDAWFNMASINEALGNKAEAREDYQHLLGLSKITDFQHQFAMEHLQALKAQ